MILRKNLVSCDAYFAGGILMLITVSLMKTHSVRESQPGGRDSLPSEGMGDTARGFELVHRNRDTGFGRDAGFGRDTGFGIALYAWRTWHSFVTFGTQKNLSSKRPPDLNWHTAIGAFTSTSICCAHCSFHPIPPDGVHSHPNPIRI